MSEYNYKGLSTHAIQSSTNASQWVTQDFCFQTSKTSFLIFNFACSTFHSPKHILKCDVALSANIDY